MIKLAFMLIACMIVAEPIRAAVSPLSESALEYEAITSALGTNPDFMSVINPSEFIVDIKRMSEQVNTIGEVNYEIITWLSQSGEISTPQTRTYIAKLDVARNRGIGRNIITVVSIMPTSMFLKTRIATEKD